MKSLSLSLGARLASVVVRMLIKTTNTKVAKMTMKFTKTTMRTKPRPRDHDARHENVATNHRALASATMSSTTTRRMILSLSNLDTLGGVVAVSHVVRVTRTLSYRRSP